MKPLEYADIEALNQSGIREKHQTGVVNRIRPCVGCYEFYDCQGFSVHVPIQDDSGICAGGLDVQHVE